MTSYFILKLFAIISMTLDHIWFSGISSNGILTCIGRLAFPIFCYQLVQGYDKTSDLKRYKLRLLLFAFISEIPFDLMCSYSLFSFSSANVIFTLFFGLLCIEAIDNFRNNKSDLNIIKSFVIVFLSFVLVNKFNTDYSYWGLITIILFYYFKDNKYKYFLFISWFFLFAYLSPQVITLRIGEELFRVNRILFTPLSVVLIYLICKIRDIDYLSLLVKKFNRYLKLFFYVYYPLHMLIIYFIK